MFLAQSTKKERVFNFQRYKKIPLEVDFESSKSPAKLQSWNKPSRHCWAVLPTWQYCRWLHVWWIYEINLASRRSRAPVHLVSDLASSFADQRMSSLPYRAKYRHFKTISGHTFDNSPTDSSSSLDSSQCPSTHFWACPFHVGDHANVFAWGFCHPGTFSVAPAEIRDSNIFFNCSKNCSLWFAFTLHTSQIYMVKKWSWFVKINIVHIFCFFPAILMSSTHIEQDNPFVGEQIDIPSRSFFPFQVTTGLPRTASRLGLALRQTFHSIEHRRRRTLLLPVSGVVDEAEGCESEQGKRWSNQKKTTSRDTQQRHDKSLKIAQNRWALSQTSVKHQWNVIRAREKCTCVRSTRNVFPTRDRQVGVRTNFVQEEPLGPRCVTMNLVLHDPQVGSCTGLSVLDYSDACFLEELRQSDPINQARVFRSTSTLRPKKWFPILLNCAKLKFVSYTSNCLEQTYGFRKCTMFHLM